WHGWRLLFGMVGSKIKWAQRRQPKTNFTNLQIFISRSSWSCRRIFSSMWRFRGWRYSAHLVSSRGCLLQFFNCAEAVTGLAEVPLRLCLALGHDWGSGDITADPPVRRAVAHPCIYSGGTRRTAFFPSR